VLQWTQIVSPNYVFNVTIVIDVARTEESPSS